MEAANDIGLELRLKHMGLDLITFNVDMRHHGLFGGHTVSMQELVMFCFELEQLTFAGIPLLDGLRDLRDSTLHPNLQKVIGELVSDVEGGKQLSLAMTCHPRVFSDVVVSLVRAGEETGKLPEVLGHLASTLKWQDELIAQTRRLLAYPLFVLAAVLVAITALMTYMVPQLVSFLHNMGQELPLKLRILIMLSDMFAHYWWLILSLPVIAVTTGAAAIRQSPLVLYRYDYVKLHLPVIGEILQKIIMARFARYFALMYQTGIPVLDAIKSCQHIASNRVVVEALERVWQQITAGGSMHESFHNAGLFPSLMVRMIRVGETTGALDKALLNISYFYDRDVRESMEKRLKMLEPVLTVVLGMLLAMLMVSVLGPVYDTLGQLKL
ncbi:type II secretion system protein F [mine drainage metagenome]|uniref:Type II secretion system protein F n=1 Tax=mine drainage metagenome TaxID=410659 RepID=A0A1J5QV69_9ZZZZ